MKRTAIFIAFTLFMASSAYAAITPGATIALTLGTAPVTGLSVYGDKTASFTAGTTPLIGKTSTGVGFGGITATTGYAIITQHLNGTKAFGSSFDSTSVYTIPVTAGTATTVIPTTADSAIFVGTGGWTSM